MWMLEGRTNGLAIFDVPQSRCVVEGCAREDAVIWRYCNAIDRVGVARENRDLLPSGSVPGPDCGIPGPGDVWCDICTFICAFF